MRQETLQRGVAWGGLLVLGAFSLVLALNRIYQVDEAQIVYMSRILGDRSWDEFLAFPSLFLLGPLASVAAEATSSENLFRLYRFLFLGIFWLNLTLIPIAAGERPWSRKGLWILLAAATLTPLWDYGFEIRHDNLLLSGLLLIWILARSDVLPGALRYGFLGGLAILLQAVSFKAFLFTLPLSTFLILLPHPSCQSKRSTLLLAWLGGAFTGMLVVRGVHALAGTWDLYLAGFQVGINTSKSAIRFGPWPTLQRLLSQTPLLLGTLAAALILVIPGSWKTVKERSIWETGRAELILFLITLAALLTNPTPYPYNLVNLIPFAFLLVLRVGEDLERPNASWLRPLALSLLGFTHLVPFVNATLRHLDFSNYRQTCLMRLAETMTNPKTDRVFDAVGLVPTRRSIHFRWFLHSLYIHEMGTPEMPYVMDMLKKKPAAVLLTSYRTDLLCGKDWGFIMSHYVQLADDFWVLGKVVKGQATWNCLAGGRYYLQPLSSLGIHEASATINGTKVSFGLQTLPAGELRIHTDPPQRARIVWVGPKLDKIPEIDSSAHTDLFVNWY